jgi:MOSC domain-containing protein YiiM
MLVGRVRSLLVGRAAPLRWQGRLVPSGIVKHPVDEPLHLGFEGLTGDEQADRSVHGGVDKPVCAYPIEHLPWWGRALGTEVPPGAFGENLSLAGLTEDRVCIGDTFTLGETTVQVNQPRGPCYKIAARWGHKRLPDLMAKAGISGFYLRVLEEGHVQPGDELRLADRRSDVTVAEVMRVTYTDRRDWEAIAKVAAVPELSPRWRASLETMLKRAG